MFDGEQCEEFVITFVFSISFYMSIIRFEIRLKFNRNILWNDVKALFKLNLKLTENLEFLKSFTEIFRS